MVQDLYQCSFVYNSMPSGLEIGLGGFLKRMPVFLLGK